MCVQRELTKRRSLRGAVILTYTVHLLQLQGLCATPLEANSTQGQVAHSATSVELGAAKFSWLPAELLLWACCGRPAASDFQGSATASAANDGSGFSTPFQKGPTGYMVYI